MLRTCRRFYRRPRQRDRAGAHGHVGQIAGGRAMTLDERLIAYIDGELSGDELKRFEAEIAADPRLAGEVEKHRSAAQRMAIARAAAVADEKARPKAAARGKAAPRVRIPLVQWAAMATALAVGVAGGVAGGHFAWPTAPEGSLVTRPDGVLVAGGALKAALTDDLGSQTGPLRGGLSFKT